MFIEQSGAELVLLAVIALIVVGPKDLPVLLRNIGRFMAKLRGMAAEFRASFDEMARQSELDDLRKEVEALRQGTIGSPGHAEAVKSDIDQSLASLHAAYGDGSGFTMPPPSSTLAEPSAIFDTPVAEAASETPGADVAAPLKPKRVRKPKAATAPPADIQPEADA